MPTRPGHWPLQLATVRMGPRWWSRPGSTWWLYCQTASATTTGASGSMRLEDVHAHALAADEAVAARWVVGVGALDPHALGLEGRR